MRATGLRKRATKSKPPCAIPDVSATIDSGRRYGIIASEWGESENKRRAKYYRLTPAGRRQLQEEARKWNHMAEIIAGILDASPEDL